MEHPESNNVYDKLDFESENSNFPMDLSHEAFEILGNEVYREFNIKESLGKFTVQENIDLLNRLDPENVFLEEDIEKLCIDKRLRFLESKYFKSDFPLEVITKIKELENRHNKDFTSFKIAATSKSFKSSTNKDAPILFLQLNEEVFYLIHQWGTPFTTLRKGFSWPLKKLL